MYVCWYCVLGTIVVLVCHLEELGALGVGSLVLQQRPLSTPYAFFSFCDFVSFSC